MDTGKNPFRIGFDLYVLRVLRGGEVADIMPRLSLADAEQRIKALDGWTLEGDAIRKQYTFRDFLEAIAFVNCLAPKAEAADHHPDILINYKRVTVAGVHDLLDAACAVVPHAWNAGFGSARVGLRPATKDGLPVIGASRAAPNLMYASGHYRNGVLLAPLTAQFVADAMLEDRIDPLMAPLSPSRFGAL